MGEYINLMVSIKEGRSDAPEVVVKRLSTDKPQTTVTFKVKAETRWAEAIYLVGNDPLLSQWVAESGINFSAKDYPVWATTISLPASTTFNYKFVKRDERDQTIWERARIAFSPLPPAAKSASRNRPFDNRLREGTWVSTINKTLKPNTTDRLRAARGVNLNSGKRITSRRSPNPPCFALLPL